MPITKPTTGTTGWDDEVNAAIDRVNDLDAVGYYPLTGYGSFHSATCAVEDVTTTGALGGGWMVRMWVKSGMTITRAGMIITGAASGDTGFNAFAVYNDDGTSLLGQTADDATFWTSTGVRSINLTSTIAASSSGRFVRVLLSNSFTSVPSTAFCVVASNPAIVNGTGLARRSAVSSSVGSFSSTIDPTTLGTTSEFLPLIFLG